MARHGSWRVPHGEEERALARDMRRRPEPEPSFMSH